MLSTEYLCHELYSWSSVIISVFHILSSSPGQIIKRMESHLTVTERVFCWTRGRVLVKSHSFTLTLVLSFTTATLYIMTYYNKSEQLITTIQFVSVSLLRERLGHPKVNTMTPSNRDTNMTQHDDVILDRYRNKCSATPRDRISSAT